MDVTHGTRLQGRRRRRVFVNTRFQVNHIISIGLLVICAFFVISLCMGWFYLQCSDDRLVCHHNTIILRRVAVVFFFFMAGMVLWSLRYTRAIAGPIETLCETLERAAAGRFPEQPVCFRRDDLFKRLAAPLDACLASMARTRSTLDNTLERIEALRVEVREGRMEPEALDEALGAIVQDVGEEK